MDEPTPSTAHPAATVALLRDGRDGCQVLLVQRNAELAFHGGAWVFPGGRLDPEDYAASGGTNVVEAARHAAVREAREEAGVVIAPEHLVLVSRWITPEPLPKRFDTWFFAAPAGGATVQVDGGEIHGHRWMRPGDAIDAHRRGDIALPPPTFVTIECLVSFQRASEALASLAGGPVETFMPRLCVVRDGACSLYPGDVGYDDWDPERPGPRHRLWMYESNWRYERSPG